MQIETSLYLSIEKFQFKFTLIHQIHIPWFYHLLTHIGIVLYMEPKI